MEFILRYEIKTANSSLRQLIAVCAGRDNVCGIEDDKMLERIQGYIDKMKNAGL